MKSVLISAWAALIPLGNVVGQWLSDLSGAVNWSQLGWAFAASTGYVIYEIIQKIVRPGSHRAGMVLLGLLVSLGLGPWVSELTHAPITPVTILLGAGGYKLFDWFQKKKLKDPEKSLKEFTGLNGD